MAMYWELDTFMMHTVGEMECHRNSKLKMLTF